MQSKFIDKKINYTGEQLRSHFIFENFGLVGDAIVSFIGECKVDDHMVDLDDKKKKEFIYSESMLHFLIEHFDEDLEKAILRKRLLISIINEEVQMPLHELPVRKGNGLYIRDKKLNVAVAAKSCISTLIHIGINISSKNTPVPVVSLNELKIDPKKLATKIINKYIEEIESISISRAKVKSVP